ncbi:thyrotropin-releasing hormone-degrading ectoenzyme isoform X2 [Anopheles cruzii]|uniref:thyrotropin-releasing hormone-degrading ectoenzyme isoform X2 n=1 Tax=Anopheles cruzii TaxID=68878 RepID=UPI0022EC4C77|nr:thyrotropin-releasing hormone-degrading ectoenzyme isoform X2 [Anopheles cruzii]
MKRRNDYKVAMAESVELEPLGGGMDKLSETDSKKRNGINKFGGDSSSRPVRDGVAVCSQKRALLVTGTVLGTLLATALVIAYAGPQTVCPCAGKMPPGYIPDGYNSSEPFLPIATNGQPFPWLLPTLPNTVKPNRYILTIHPNLTTLDVKGQVSIELYVEKETNFVVLHAQDLNITEKALVGPKGFALKILRMLEYTPRQQLYIETREKLRKKANYTLSIRWHSKMILDQFEGDFDVKKTLAATVLKPGSTRKAFPCFDEPHLRAAFKISLFRDRFHIGLSNSIVQDTDDVGFYMGTGLLRDDFAETPPLPPDSVSWVISDFKRELLEPSAKYQRVNVSKADGGGPPGKSIVPSGHAGTNGKPPTMKVSKSDKKPFRNLTAVLLSKNLFKLTNNLPTKEPAHGESDVTVHPAGELTTPAVAGDDRETLWAGDTALIRTAPAYSFYAPETHIGKGSFILHTSRDILEYLQQWLSVAYPLSKLDFVALPSLLDDISSSLGLIVCRTSFLNEPNSISGKEYHMSVVKISEGIVKQYFGGLISPKSWKNKWLWEGLIRYLSRFLLATIQPLWPMKELFLIDTLTKALDIDALQGWDSINVGASDTGDNDPFFVDKSASLLSMLQSAIGERNFRQCLGKFLRTYQFQTAEPADLWVLCAKQVNSSRYVKEMMTQWTNTPAFPLLNVTLNGTIVTVRQTDFRPAEYLAIYDEPMEEIEGDEAGGRTTTTSTTLAPTSDATGNAGSRWVFPIHYTTNVLNGNDTTHEDPEHDHRSLSVWLNSSEAVITLNHTAQWIKINYGQTGYYRVLYNEANWIKLVDQLHSNNNVFSTQDRVGLVSDIFTLCHANLIPCHAAMELISYFPKEKEWGPVMLGTTHLEKWRKILKYSECYLVLAEYVRQNLAKSIQAIGWEDIGEEEVKLLRPVLMLSAALWEESDTIKYAKGLVINFTTQSTPIPPNLRAVAYIGSVLSGEFQYWQFCWDRYIAVRRERSSVLEERMELLRALGVTKDAWLQNRLLSHVITLPVFEIVQVLDAIAGTPTGGAMACRFLQAKWFDFQSKLGRGTVQFARVISAITQYGSTKFDYDELKSLVNRFGDGPGLKLLNMTLSTVAANVEWVSRSQASIYNWIENKYHF